MQTEGLGPDASDYAALGISIHQMFVACQSVKESIFGLMGDLEKIPFLFLRRLQFPGGDMETTDVKY